MVLGPVADAFRLELVELAKRAPELASGALAMSALRMAEILDSPTASATSRTMAQARFQQALEQLRSLTPAGVEGDAVDDLAVRRQRRLGGSAASA